MDTSLPLQQYSVQVKGKTFGIRAGAYIIDSVVYVILNYAIQFVEFFLVGIVLYLSGREFSIDEQSSQGLSFMAGLALFFLYFVIFESLYGATPGKLILGMRVIREDGRPCGLGAALLRGLLRFIDGLFFGIPAYASMKEPLYQRIGDKSAKTLVVSSQDATIRQGRVWWWFLIASGLYLALDSIVSMFLVFNMIR